MIVVVLIFLRGIVIEAAKKRRPKGDVTKDQIQSPTPGSNNKLLISSSDSVETKEASDLFMRF